jgi:hypothetical protein
MISNKNIEKLKRQLEVLSPVATDMLVENFEIDNEKNSVLVKMFIHPKDGDSQIPLSEHFEDMIVRSLGEIGYECENTPTYGFIVKNMGN